MRWTIIVCTFNRARDLAETIERLRCLSYPADDHEIVVVDNASTDETPEIIGKALATIPNLVSLRAEKPGLSHARNKGIAAARGELVAFIDDDAWPDKNWLHALDAGFVDAETACAGGRVEAVWPHDTPPAWLAERLFCFFSLVDYGKQKFLSYPDYPAGTNIAFRKSVFRELGLFREELGRTGASLLSMEEVDMCLRIEDAGLKVLYLPDAVVFHKIGENRICEAWLEQRSHWQGVSAALIEAGRLTNTEKIRKIAKYLIFVAGGTIGKIVCNGISNKKLGFFCRCQIILCKAYIKQLLSGWR
jgi:GT2 family glycosyltransferase